MSVEFENFEQPLLTARDLPALPIAVIDADRLHVLEGAYKAAEAGYIDPVPIGDETAICNLLAKTNLARKFRIIHAPKDDVMAGKGIELIENGQVKALMKGHIHTDEFPHPVLVHCQLNSL